MILYESASKTRSADSGSVALPESQSSGEEAYPRSYKKNDQDHIEPKDWSVVRRAVGYDRHESPQALRQLQELYRIIRIYVNFFQPVTRRVGKERFGARVNRWYDDARTPYRCIPETEEVSQIVKDELQAVYLTLYPVGLRRQIDDSLNRRWNLALG